MVELATTIWADGPSSDPYEPNKAQIREWGAWVEGIITAFLSGGGLIYSSRAALDADLAHAANSMAWVIGDPVAANNGVYGKVGASGTGSWTRRSDLPFSFIIASDAGDGTPNAIQATTSIPVSGSALIWMNIFEANTASPVTVSFNAGSALTIKTNAGNDVAVGGLTAGMIVMGIVSGSTFRLVSDQASAALLSQMENILADFQSRYLGAYANDAAATAAAGGSPIEGAEYWNSTIGARRVWHSGAWVPGSIALADGDVTFPKLAADVPEKVFQAYFPGISNDVQGTGLPGTDGDSLIRYAFVTSATQESNTSVHRVQKLVDYIGGTPGDVKTASWVLVQVEDGPTDFQWAGLDHLINKASAGENVARFSKAEKRGTGATWASCLNIEDHTGATSGAAIGQEITALGNGVDTLYLRNGLNIAIHKLNGAGQDLEWGRGFWTSNKAGEAGNRFRKAFDNTAPIGLAVYSNSGNDVGTGEGAALLRDYGSLARGVDLSAATYSTNEAIRLAVNHRIAFDVGGTHYMLSNGTVIQVVGARLQPQSGLSFPSAGLVTTTATAGGVAKPATYSGFLSILIDGVPMKVPYYSN